MMKTYGSWLEDLLKAGGMSIVVQGGLTQANLLQVATACEHWRDLFPMAQLILSISATDVLLGRSGEDGRLTSPRLVPAHRHDGMMRAALRVLLRTCDDILLSEQAVPLPPVKTAPAVNNGNLQIAAARSGLEHARGIYVLRIRNDAILNNRDFLRYYYDMAPMPRGRAVLLSERVLISELFTLNPFTLERMPFHYSDWLHFGLRRDVERIWDVKPISLEDAIFYRLNPRSEKGNELENMFLARRAVEQHIVVEGLGKLSSLVHLERHNEYRMATTSMAVLVDNFIVADMRRCGLYLEKYLWNFDHPDIHLITVSAEDWRYFATSGDRDFESYYRDKIRICESLPQAAAQRRDLAAAARPGVLRAGDSLTAGDVLTSLCGSAMLRVSDGCIILERALGEKRTAVQWAASSVTEVDRLSMQEDGNLVGYRANGAPVWASNTDGNDGAWLRLGDDGRLVVGNDSGALWSS